MLKPGGLIRSLRTYQHQDGMVDHRVVHPSCHHRHQPPPQTLGEELLVSTVTLYADGGCQQHDMVYRTIPPLFALQLLQVVLEGIVGGHEVRIYHALHILYAHGLLLCHLCPQRVYHSVGESLVALVRFLSVVRQFVILYMLRYHVKPQQYPFR